MRDCPRPAALDRYMAARGVKRQFVLSLSMPVTVRPIPPEQTHALRHRILRPHHTAAQVNYDRDDDADTVHFGAFDGGALVGIGSLYRQGLPGDEHPDDWQLRGMAVLESHQRGGVGTLLMAAFVSHLAARGGERFWCNARTTACGFYERFGLRRHGEVFDAVAIGPHVVMVADAAALRPTP